MPDLPLDPAAHPAPAPPTANAAPPLTTIPQPQANSNTQDEINDAAILLRMRDRGRNRRSKFMDVFDKAEQYSYSENYDKLLYTNDPATNGMQFKAKINRAAEFTDIMGTYLFPKVPNAQVNSRPWADYWQRKRHAVEQDYLTYAMFAGDFHQHMRKEITESLLSGRSALYTGYNENKQIVQNVYRCVRDLLMDPDARSGEEVNWVAIKRSKPKWELKEHIAQVRGDREMDSLIDGLSSIPDGSNATNQQRDDRDRENADYYEFYLRVGLWRFGETTLGQSVNEEGSTIEDDSPRKFYWVPGRVIAVSEWELPWNLIDEWPIEWLDLRPRPNHLWPASPIENGLTHIENLNFMYTFYASRIRFAWRTFLISINYNGTGVSDDELMKLVFAGDFSFLRVKVTGNELDFSKLVQQFKFDSGIDEFERAWALASNEFAKATGLSEIMYSGEGQRQARVSADVDLRKDMSTSRVQDMLQLTINHESRVMRKTLFAARFLQGPDEITKILGPEAGQIWGTLAAPEQVAAEKGQRQQMKAMLMQQANQMQAQYQKMMASMPPPMVAPGMPPPMPPPPPPMPSEDDLERQLGPPQFVALESWIHEADRTVDAGSARAQDFDTKLQSLQMMVGQYGPMITALPEGAQTIATAMLEIANMVQLSSDMRQSIQKMVKATVGMQPAGMAPSAPAPVQPNGRPPGSPTE